MGESAQDQAFLKGCGIDVNLDLPQSCADFYLLERLAFEGEVGGARRLAELEKRLSNNFQNYLIMTVGGELRHLIRTHRECGVVIPHELAGYIERVTSDEKEVDENGDEYDTDIGRFESWMAWERMLSTGQLTLATALPAAVRVFADPDWTDPSVGGAMWSTCARVVTDYVLKRIKARIFIDRCFTLEHNNGCVFDKVYRTARDERLGQVLAIQATDDYMHLARKASAEVRSLWLQRERRTREDYDPAWLGRQRPEVYE